MGNTSDKSLWFSFVDGDLTAFSKLFKIYYPQLHNYGLKISGNRSLTEDSLQSFFIYLFENRKSLEKISSLRSYFYVSYRRAILKTLKKERQFTTYNQTIENSKVFEFSIEELMIKQEITKVRTEKLTAILNLLSARQREVIYLKYYCELDTAEISEVMNITYQSVLNTLQKAFSTLRKHIETHEIMSALRA